MESLHILCAVKPLYTSTTTFSHNFPWHSFIRKAYECRRSQQCANFTDFSLFEFFFSFLSFANIVK